MPCCPRAQTAARLKIQTAVPSAYFLDGVVPQWELKQIYAGMAQLIFMQVVSVGILIAFPQLATWLPKVMAN